MGLLRRATGWAKIQSNNGAGADADDTVTIDPDLRLGRIVREEIERMVRNVLRTTETTAVEEKEKPDDRKPESEDKP